MSEDRELEAITAFLEDEYAREILAQTSIEPMSAETLADRCNASSVTIYDRIERLSERDLLQSQQQLDPNGHHYKTYEARLERVEISLHDGQYEIEVTRAEPTAADRFSSLVDGLK